MIKLELYLKILDFIKSDNLEQLKNLINNSNINGVISLGINRCVITPLASAILYRKYRIVEFLLEMGADPNIVIYTNGSGFADFKEPAKIAYNYSTYLSYAIAEEGFLYSQDFEEEPRMESIKLLIKYGADINAFNQKYDTPLDVARDNFHYLAEKYLISLGAKTSEELGIS